MNLFAWGLDVETEPAWTNAPLRRWRWTLQLHRSWIGFAQQVRFPGRDWYDIRHYGIGVWLRWRWGFVCVYYDGPHCALNLGPINVFWDPNECSKCTEGM